MVIGSGAEKFARMVNEYAKGCPVCIVYDIDPYHVARAMRENTMSVKLVQADKASAGMSYRYYVGLGSERAAIKARQLAAGEKKYALYCDFLGGAAFSGGYLLDAGEKNFAEFAYFDTDCFPLDKTEKYLKGLINLLTLATALLDKAAMTVLYPVSDTALEIALESVKNFFTKRTDKDKFLKTLITLIKTCAEYAAENNLCPVAVSVKERLGREISLGAEFFIDYMLLYLCIIFTKWDFFDMLIPAENLSGIQPFQERLLLASKDELDSLFFTRQSLRIISKTLKGMGLEVTEAERKEVFASLERESALSGGFYAVMSLMGIINGILPQK